MNCLSTTDLFWLLNAHDSAPGVGQKIDHMVVCPACQARFDQLAQAIVPLLDHGSIAHQASVQPLHSIGPGTGHWLDGLSHLRVIRQIGQGGMGEVYLCQDTELGRAVAVKTLRADKIRPDLLLRHRREALLQASLNHPNIVAVYDFQVGPTGLPYFVMEYVEGQTLSACIASRSLTARSSTEIILQVARAVAFSHQNQVLHRDLKPSNILLKPNHISNHPSIAPDDPGHGDLPGLTPKITDFGLARLLQPGLDLTTSQNTLGTPAYLAPESISVAFGEVGPGTDIYALGVMLYECFTGRPPFLAGTVAETLNLIQQQVPVPPRVLNPSLPRDLETICLKCLEKEPSRRYPTAQALAGDLHRFLQGLPILARPTGKCGKALRWCRRNRRLTAALATAAASLALLASGSVWFAFEQKSLRLIAEEHAAEAHQAQNRAARYSDLARNNFMASLTQIHQVEGRLRQLAENHPSPITINTLWQELTRRKTAIAGTYLTQSMKLAEPKGIDLDRVFKDAMAMNDIGLRHSAIPVLEKLRQTSFSPAETGADEHVRLSIGLKTSTMLALWANDEGRRDHATRLLRQAWHQWPINLDDRLTTETLLVDRATLSLIYLSIVGPGAFPEEAKAVEAELAAINTRITQRKTAVKYEASP